MYQDRRAGGEALGRHLRALGLAAPVVVGVPRGGVVVGGPVAAALGCPLYALPSQKVNAPEYPELSVGAVAPRRARYTDAFACRLLQVSPAEFAVQQGLALAELRSRTARYRDHLPPTSLTGHTVVVVDDGLATGATARAAIAAVRRAHPQRVVLAVPAASPYAVAALRPLVDDVVAPLAPVDFRNVGSCYQDFSPATDAQVAAALGVALLPPARLPGRPLHPAPAVPVPAGDVTLPAEVRTPGQPWAVALFVHGSGSSRESPRNLRAAAGLRRAGVATLLLDLLTPAEAAASGGLLWDVPLPVLAQRVAAVVRWAGMQPGLGSLPLVLFGNSLGAAVAAMTAAGNAAVAGLVTRGGRWDQAMDVAAAISQPVLLVAGTDDPEGVYVSREARRAIGRERTQMVAVPGAGHLLEEPGAIEAFTRVAVAWMRQQWPGRGP